MNKLFKLFRQTVGFSRYLKYSRDVTAGVLIIGDEILKGTVDLNSPYLIQELNQINVKVLKVSIVPDNITAIAHEVSDMSSKYTYVFTSGGIGPTHDDITYEAIAKAFNEEIVLNEELFKFLVNYFGPDSEKNPGVLKYSNIPKSGIVKYVDLPMDNRKIKYPLVSVKNIYIFPGIPSLLKKSFSALKSNFIQVLKKSTKEIFIDLDEFTVIKVLNEAVKLFTDVNFGSYPTFSNNYYKIKLVLECSSSEKIEEACKYLASKLPVSSIVNIKENILLNAPDQVYLLKAVFSPVKEALSVIEYAIDKYSLSELCLCFNGGKDCTALLHLIYACVKRFKPCEWNKLHYLYISNGEEFEEVDYFIKKTVEQYNLNLTVLKGDLRVSVSHYLRDNSNIKAMFMGTRKDDPGAKNLKTFSMTDSDWPSVLRILPIISWSYADVWYFIRTLQLPYCILYDRGYTSLGLKSNTFQNPSLLHKNVKGFSSYKPAYTLVDNDKERKNRF